ncbi:hypothetical protein [Mesobacillus foraminis]|uniref:hypothetical protein n=1 Tax=Mesobacillus foraminis TaxID=279826 RepID=UPI0013CE4C9A|nr:hypothetical protein [Mesobacillus foraminis]
MPILEQSLLDHVDSTKNKQEKISLYSLTSHDEGMKGANGHLRGKAPGGPV